ncbi:hypothetical protein QN277_020190 [Acacia crassicarpa]|uniref:Dof zinc finger protein n=1 Tax=Acacia crassicarpa TaxID=499986 RepID=A0AAE1JMG3_9FABA|nr:hypothetical protein QN277_020190 [Acacia crassicarpa]
MGLSSKKVSSSGIGWNQNLLQDQKLELPKPPLMRKQQQQIQSSSSSLSSEPLKCPRCDSINTKFCYYNNYNKSQPRHFCRTCKRHWTKGGTLRNVPVGGGRKNKRVKKSSSSSTPISSSAAAAATSGMPIQSSLQRPSNNNLPPPPSSSASLFQSLIPSQPLTLLLPPSHQNLMNPRDSQQQSKGFGIGNCTESFLTSTLPLLPHQNQSFIFPFSSSSSASFETNPCSVSNSLRSSSVYNNFNNYGQELKTMEEPTPTQTQTQPWEIPSTSVAGNTEMSNYWTWEDLDSLVSTDLNVPWDDSDLKP